MGVDPSTLTQQPASNVRTLQPAVDARPLGSAPDTHAGARVRETTATVGAFSFQQPQRVAPGKQQLAAVDALAVEQLQSFIAQLEPESTVRVERLRPSWAAGILEDVLLDTGELDELIEHVRDEHGGQRYRLTLLSANGVALVTAKLNIAGPPLKDGRRVSRAYWRGEDEPRTAQLAQATPATPAPSPMSEIGTLLAALGPFLAPRDNREVLEAVRDVARASAEQTGALVRSIVASQNPKSSLVTQLNEVISAQRAIGKLRLALGAGDEAPASSSQGDSGNESLFSGAVREVAKDVLAAGLRNSIGAPRAPASAQQQAHAAPPSNVRRVIRKAE